jgi:hypothetical protein
LLKVLRVFGPRGSVDTLLARDPAVHARLDDPVGVASLQRELYVAGAKDVSATCRPELGIQALEIMPFEAWI